MKTQTSPLYKLVRNIPFKIERRATGGLKVPFKSGLDTCVRFMMEQEFHNQVYRNGHVPELCLLGPELLMISISLP